MVVAKRVHAQQRSDSNKVYRIHAPEVECIAKGKAHKRYEFGCKVSLLATVKKSWVVGIKAFHGNPYDGHTLKSQIAQVERITKVKVEDALVDHGYKGKENHPAHVKVYECGKRESLRIKDI